MAQDQAPDLEKSLEQVKALHHSITTAPSSHFSFKAPVIDRQSSRWASDLARGINKFEENVLNFKARVEAMIEQGIVPQEDPLPSVEAMTTVWKTVLTATPPIAAVRIPMRADSARKRGQEVFVDAVARGGEEWIKIYSKKVSNLLAEFREQDSMVNSDWDDSEDDQPGPSTRPEKRPLTNTLLDMVDELLRFADCTDRPPGSASPKLTLRVTRIVPECDIDPRVQETFNVIRSKGVRIEFGDLAEIPLLQLPVVLPEHQLRPSRRICLDPTALMALCSDLLHYPLPATRAEALRRFFRPSEKLQDKPGGRDATGPGREGEEAEKEEWRGQSQNSRELVKNVLEEMDIALIEEIRDLLTRTYGGGASIEWWTTREAVVYLTEALGSEEVVGDGMEQKRMRRLIGLEEGDFFEGSRYEGQAGVLSPLRLRIFDQDALDPVDPPTSFHRSLASVAQSCIDDYATYTRSPSKKTLEALPNFLKPQRIPVPKVAQLSSPFPIVSLQTLARGAKEGMTTLMMGNVVLRDLFGQPRWKVHGWTQASYEMEMPKMSEGEPIDAAVWMLPYRSLGEGQRVKFKRGDYSYPHHR